MTENAFTAGIKPGGLTTTKEIRILLCYIVLHAPAALTQAEIETALLSEELVNYFEMADALAELQQNGMLVCDDGRFSVTDKGREIAKSLEREVPASVRDSALRAVISAQQYAKKEAEHITEIAPCEGGYTVKCHIADMGSDIFSTSLYMPTKAAAEQVQKRFVENGDEVYKLMLACLTDNKQLIRDILENK